MTLAVLPSAAARRRSRRLSLPLALAAGIAAFAPHAYAQDEEAPPVEEVQETVFAVVDGYEITERDLGFMVQVLGEAFNQIPQNQQLEVLIESAIEFRLTVDAAEETDVDQSEEFQERMAFLRAEQLRSTYLNEIVGARVEEEEIRAAYDEWVAGLDLPTEVQIQAIRVATEAEAEDVLRRLDEGEDFADIALEESLDRNSAENGGVVREIVDGQPRDYWAPGELFQEFDDVVFNIEPGTVYPVPILRGESWHVVGVTDRRQQPPPTFEEMRETFRQELFRTEYSEVLEELRAAAEIERLVPGPQDAPEDAAPAIEPVEPADPDGG